MNSSVLLLLLITTLGQLPSLDDEPLQNLAQQPLDLSEFDNAPLKGTTTNPLADDWTAADRAGNRSQPATINRNRGAGVAVTPDELLLGNDLGTPETTSGGTRRITNEKLSPKTTINGTTGSRLTNSPIKETPDARTPTKPGLKTTVPTTANRLSPAEDMADQVTSQAAGYYNTASKFIRDHGLSLLGSLLKALAVYIIGRWIAGILTVVFCGVMERARVDPLIVRFARNVMYCAMMIFVILGSLSVLGVNVESAAAVLAAAGFAVGLALQGSLANFAAGILLIALKPFKVGDEIESNGFSGNVEEINIFNTILRSSGNVQVIIPNGQITGNVIRNNTAHPVRRIEMTVGCSYGDDLREVKSLLERMVADERRILREPGAAVFVTNLAECGVQFAVHATVKTSDYSRVKSDLTERIKLSFDQNGFTIPFPSRDLYVHTANVIPMAKSA